MRRRFIALPLAALASLALASVAMAGGWAQVTIKDRPVDPVAGQETTIELNVHQHGITPVSWPTLTVVATDATSGAVIRTEAEAQGPAGSYVATMVFPSAGEWALTFESAELEMAGSFAMNVAPGVIAAQAAVQAGAAAPVASTFDVMPLLLLLVAAAIALAIAGVALRSRGAAGGARVSART
jgi:hypothetical protein